MRVTPYTGLALAGLASRSFAQQKDLLFPFMNNLTYLEYNQAISIGFSGKSLSRDRQDHARFWHRLTGSVAYRCQSEEEWYNLTTADFAKYKAIVIPDPTCNTSLKTLDFFNDTKKVWTPAVKGNVILIGTDPSFHAKWYSLAGAYAMMQDGIRYAASTANGSTGMYFSLSCYYQSVNSEPVASLSEMGDFMVRGNISHPCLNNTHLVARSPAITKLDDKGTSDWNCSVHEVFSHFPRDGPGGFEALAIAVGATGNGEASFADNTTGIPYIVTRGATPVGCGDDVVQASYSEECDSGDKNGSPGDPCDASCKCINGMIAPGECRSNSTSSSTTTGSTSFTNSSSTTSSSSFTNSSSTISSTSFYNARSVLR